MSFRQTSTMVSLLFFMLSMTLVLVPDLIYWLFGLEGNELGDFLAKRAGVLFLGLSLLCFYSRNTTSPEVENVVAMAVGVAMAAMALLGIYELIRSNAGAGILVAIVVEIFIAALFYRIWRENRSESQT